MQSMQSEESAKSSDATMNNDDKTISSDISPAEDPVFLIIQDWVLPVCSSVVFSYFQVSYQSP